MPYIPVELKVIEARAARVATSAAGDADRILGQLVRMWHRCWAEKTERLDRAQLAGIFGFAALDVMIPALITEEFLDAIDCTCARCVAAGEARGRHRVGGAHKFVRLREAFARGGRKAHAGGNLQGSSPKAPALRHSLDPEIPRSRDPEIPRSRSPRSRDPEPAAQPKGKRTRALSESERCWEALELDRLNHCEAEGVDPGQIFKLPPAVKCNTTIGRAISDAGFTGPDRFEQLADLFELYLEDSEFGLTDKDGKPRDRPWPVPLFLSTGVITRFAKQLREEAA